MNTVKQYTAVVGNKAISFEVGKLAGQADGAVLARHGDTMLLATATMSKQPREGVDFFPLSVDYEERLYAAGRIPGSFFRREGRPAEAAILIARLADRALRPLFPNDLRNEVQIILTALSSDSVHHIDILGINAASAALAISGIPWDGPVGAVRIGYIDGQLVINPTIPEMATSTLDLRVAGTADAILMVEAGADEVPEELIVEGLRLAYEAIQPLVALQEQMRAEIGKPRAEYVSFAVSEELKSEVTGRVGNRIRQALLETIEKEERNAVLDAIEGEVLSSFETEEDIMPADVKGVLHDLLKSEVRSRILREGVRPDGRGPKDIRPITCEVGLLPRTHGSGLFQRGETQVLSIVTLGTPRDEQLLDGLSPEESKRFMHHYNFPPFCTGETRFLRGPSRREIGHGALVERALEPMIPPETTFPYTIRVVSEVLSSNGSTSMASVCASTLALMDAGVPIKAPVAGVAMGLIKEGDEYAILTDIQGIEDHLGDMDFKVAGTRQGVTALQMDIKIKGITPQIMAEALAQAREARLFILEKMLAVLPAPRPHLSPYAPHMTILHIDPDKIGTLIGPGGKVVRSIQEQTGVKIDIEDDGTVFVAGTNGAQADRAVEMIRALVEEPEVGKIYTGKVVRITDFGAFVEILPGTDGMVHISQLSDRRVNRVEDVVQVGDEIMVMVTDIGPDGKVRLSRAAVLEGLTPEEARERDLRSRGGTGSSGGSRPGGGRSERGGARPGGARPGSRPSRRA